MKTLYFRFGAQAYGEGQILRFNKDMNKVAVSFLSGLFAGTMEAIFAVCPMETVKVKFINDMNRGKFSTFFSSDLDFVSR